LAYWEHDPIIWLIVSGKSTDDFSCLAAPTNYFKVVAQRDVVLQLLPRFIDYVLAKFSAIQALPRPRAFYKRLPLYRQHQHLTATKRNGF